MGAGAKVEESVGGIAVEVEEEDRETASLKCSLK